MELERAVRARLEVLGVTQSDCASALGWTPQRLRGAITSANPRLSTLRVLAAICAVPVSALVQGPHATASYRVPSEGHLDRLKYYLGCSSTDPESEDAMLPDWPELEASWLNL